MIDDPGLPWLICLTGKDAKPVCPSFPDPPTWTDTSAKAAYLVTRRQLGALRDMDAEVRARRRRRARHRLQLPAAAALRSAATSCSPCQCDSPGTHGAAPVHLPSDLRRGGAPSTPGGRAREVDPPASWYTSIERVDTSGVGERINDQAGAETGGPPCRRRAHGRADYRNGAPCTARPHRRVPGQESRIRRHSGPPPPAGGRR